MENKKLYACYCYPSSPHSEKYNNGKACYLVFNHNVNDCINPAKFDNREEAISFFEACTNIDWFKTITRYDNLD